MRVATVDIGTNTVLLLVADRRGDGTMVAVEQRATVTRLGEGVDVARRFSTLALERTQRCIDEYAGVVRSLGADRIAVVGTSAMRDAAGGDALMGHIHASFGVAARVITGQEEARLTFRGALGGLPATQRVDRAVFDIGGGSTEVVLGDFESGRARIGHAFSFDVGSVRLTERHVRSDPPTPTECSILAQAARDAFVSVPQLKGGQVPVGIAGTMTTLAAVSLRLSPYDGERVHGHPMRRDALQRVVEELASMPLVERRKTAGMEPQRADVIVAGGFIALALLEHWNADSVVVSDRGVRWGLAEELASGPTDVERPPRA
jgi:exopolyphosphatase/guanosine-5'-triphosphate,3'-diphosphate pyrophosphatase